MPSDGWPPSDEDAPMHGIVLGAVIGTVAFLLAFALLVVAWVVVTGWTP